MSGLTDYHREVSRPRADAPPLVRQRREARDGVPAKLRNQWSQELADKCHLPSAILETRTFNERYLHEATVDPLIRMAVGHYQFEAIRPFTDGKGRTGRILNLPYLVEQNLLESPTLYLSRGIIRSKADYYGLLNDVTSLGAWEPWVLFMLNTVAETARWTTGKIRAIRVLSV